LGEELFVSIKIMGYVQAANPPTLEEPRRRVDA